MVAFEQAYEKRKERGKLMSNGEVRSRMWAWLRRAPVALSAALILGAVMIGVVGAQDDQTINGCVDKKTEVLRVVNKAKCKESEKPISFNQQGPQGAQGPKGDPATKLFAVVNSIGTIDRDSGANFATKTGEGSYVVIFDQDVSQCAYLATIGRADTDSAPTGEVSVGLASGVQNNAGVFVSTRGSNGSPTDKPFHLAVFC